MARGNDYEIWTRFVEANYLIDAKTYEGKCPSCNSPRDCNNYYCLQCKLGGLCPTTFRGNGAHTGHRWLQVRRQSHRSAVDPEELAKYLPHESTKHIQKCLLNDGRLCYLRTDHHQASTSSRPPAKRAKTGRGQPSPLKSCEACNKAIANSQDCKEDFLLCSVECLITLAQRHPRRNLLRMRDGALAPTHEFPQTALEKIKRSFTGSSSKSSSKALAVIDDRSGSSSGGENDAVEPLAVREPPPVRGSSGRRSAPVNYRVEPLAVREPPALRGSSGRRSPPVNHRVEPPAVRGSSGRRSAPVNYRELHRGGAGSGTAAAAETRVGEQTASRTQESGGTANRTQAAPDYSAYPLEYRSAGLDKLIAAAEAIGDWDEYLGNLGRD